MHLSEKTQEFTIPRKGEKINEQNIKPSHNAKAIYTMVEKYFVNENILFITLVKKRTTFVDTIYLPCLNTYWRRKVYGFFSEGASSSLCPTRNCW